MATNPSDLRRYLGPELCGHLTEFEGSLVITPLRVVKSPDEIMAGERRRLGMRGGGTPHIKYGQ